MKTSYGIRCLFVGLIVCVLFASCGETEKKRRTVGYKGEARTNAFLAVQRMFRKQGLDVITQQGIGRLDHEIATLFLPPSSLNTVGRAKRVIEWVDGGGHLVLMMEGGSTRGDDFRIRSKRSPNFDDDPAGLGYLLEELDVEMVEWENEALDSTVYDMKRDDWEALDEKKRALLGSEETKLILDEQSLDVRHWSEIGLKYELEYEGEYGSEEGNHRYLSLYHGDGRVTLLADASPLRNRYIGYADHARFAMEVAGMSRGGSLVFSSGEGDGFLGLVWRYFWMAVIGLLAVIVFWLWKNLPRFGPEQDLPESNMREFSDQVRGIGRFLWRHKCDDAMLAALRASVSRRLSLGAQGNHEGIFEQLATTTAIPVESIIEAMTREQIREPGVMVRVVKNLQRILKNIN